MMEDRRYTYSIQSTCGSFLQRTRCQSYFILYLYHYTPKFFLALKKDRFRKNLVFQPSFLRGQVIFPGRAVGYRMSLAGFPILLGFSPERARGYHRASFLCQSFETFQQIRLMMFNHTRIMYRHFYCESVYFRWQYSAFNYFFHTSMKWNSLR